MKLLGYGGHDDNFTVVETIVWHVLLNLTGQAYVDASFISPDMKLLGYGGDDNEFIVLEATGWQVVTSLTCSP